MIYLSNLRMKKKNEHIFCKTDIWYNHKMRFCIIPLTIMSSLIFMKLILPFQKIVRCVVKIDANIGMKPEKAKLFIIFFAFVMDCDRPFWFMAKYSTLFPYLLYMRQKAEKTFKFKYIHIELSKSFGFKWFTFHIYASILYSS